MLLIASVVFYNPSEDCVRRAVELSKVFDHVVIVDNSSVSQPSLGDDQRITYIPLGSNQGIAVALNKALQFAKNGPWDFLMTFDQDSVYPASRHTDVLAALERQKPDVAIYSLNPEGTERVKETEWQHPNFAITSGSFLRLSFFRENPISFMEELFIDGVDFEFNRQVLLRGGKIAENPDITFGHTIGAPMIVPFLWKRVRVMNHSPIRYYYRFRNTYYLYHLDKEFYKYLYREVMRKERAKLYFLEPDSKNKIRMVKRGIRDAKHGILGPFLEK